MATFGTCIGDVWYVYRRHLVRYGDIVDIYVATWYFIVRRCYDEKGPLVSGSASWHGSKGK